MKKMLFALLAVMMLFAAGCSMAENNVDVDPNPHNADEREDFAVLYFADRTGRYLIPEYREIDVPANQSREEYIMKELISGPADDHSGKLAVINPECKVVSLKMSEDVLTVTLDNKFFNWSYFGAKSQNELDRLKHLAVTSIANSMVEATGCSRIQLLIDKDGSGVGSRALAIEVGMGGDEAEVLGPMGWNGELVLDVEKTVSVLLDAIQRSDVDMAYSIISYRDEKQSLKPGSNEFENDLQELPYIENFEICGSSENPKNGTCCVMISCSLRGRDGQVEKKENFPLELIRENDAWKIEYNELISILTQGEGQ